MSSQELRFRCGQVARRAVDRREWRRQDAPPQTTSVYGGDLLKNSVRLISGASRAELDRLRTSEPELYRRLSQRAVVRSQAIHSGDWRSLGHSFDLRSPFDWHCDPRTEYRWPNDFYADLPLYDLPVGVDVKYVWEAGRHQYVVELAHAWLLAGDETSVELALATVLDWIESNPLYGGIHWTSGLEVAMRAISWIWAVAALTEWDGWQPDDLERIAVSLREHATFLEHHFSFYSSPYNHLIGEATALFLISIVMGGDSAAARWQGKSVAVLREHGPRQFYSDGFCVEQAMGYHFYTLGFLAQAIWAARISNIPLDGLEAVTRRAFIAGHTFRRSDGRWPPIGDIDSARSIPVIHDDFWCFESLCELGAVLFEEPGLKQSTYLSGEEAYWLFGVAGIERWKSLAVTEKVCRAHFPESGYMVAGNDRDWVLFDSGPVAHGLHSDATPSTAHGHADVFQLQYMQDGKEILIDSGMPFYGGGRPDWVEYFRSAAAHNTFEVEDAGPVRPAGSLAWSHEAGPPRLTAHLTESAWLTCGLAEWANGAVKIERHVLVIPGCGLWAADLIETDRPRMVRWHWISQRSFATFSNGDSVFADDPNGIIPFWVRASGEPVIVETVVPEEGSPQARFSPGYGECKAAAVVRVSARVDRRILVVTRIGTTRPFQVRCGGLALSSDSFDEVCSFGTSEYSHSGADWRIANKADIISGSLEEVAGLCNAECIEAQAGGIL